jgi:hypothetical protein
MPNLRINLISQCKLADKGIIVEFGNKRVLFKRPDGAILVKGRRIGQNWLLNVKKIHQFPASKEAILSISIDRSIQCLTS